VLCNTETSAYNNNGDSGGPYFVLGDDGLAYFSGVTVGNDNRKYYYSPLSQIDNDFPSTLTLGRGTNLSTPTLSGTVSGSYPSVSWNTVSNATFYELYRSWCIREPFTLNCSSASNGFEYIGRTYTPPGSYLDAEKNVSSYNGTTMPSIAAYGYVAYQMYARNSKDYSQVSSTVYFVLAP
jgi:hypothetical protein